MIKQWEIMHIQNFDRLFKTAANVVLVEILT